MSIKTRAQRLRKQQKSYNEISKKLGIAKSTLSGWFSANKDSILVKDVLTKRARSRAVKQLRLMAAANKRKWQLIHQSYRREARKEFSKLLYNQYFVPGIMLYWGEGDKRLKNGVVRISNVDEKLLKLFIRFLASCCDVELGRIKAWLLLYPDHQDVKCKQHWSKSLDIPPKQFLKSQFISGRAKNKRLPYGVCSVQVNSRELKEKIIEWINLYSKNI